MARAKTTTPPPKTKMICVVDVPRSPRRKVWMGRDQSSIGRKTIERLVDEMIATRYRPAPRRAKVKA